MDPLATLLAAVAAAQDDDWDDVDELIGDYNNWIASGGFRPEEAAQLLGDINRLEAERYL